jgi:hypothetical protein
MSVDVSGHLESLGFEEVEPGLIEDTHQNRRALQMQDPPWTYVRELDEEGVPCGLIRPISPEALTKTRRKVHDRRRPLLVDPDDPWSDYVHPDDYPLDVEMPWWVDMRLRTWREQAAAGVPESERRRFPIRCTQLRTDNTRCWNWVGHPDKLSVCKAHSDQTREAVLKTPAYARERVLELSVDAVDTLAHLMNFAVGEAVRLKASTEVLDRAGVRGGTEIDMNVTVGETDPAQALQDRLRTLAKRAEVIVTEEPDAERPALPAVEIVDAEIVDDEAETA